MKAAKNGEEAILMIRIQKSDEVEEEFFCTRNFGESIESVRDILRNVKLRKDEALRE